MRAVAQFSGVVNPVNPLVSDLFCRELIRVAAVPNGLARIRPARWNGPATQLDKEHGSLILLQATEPRDFIVREMTDRKAVASNSPGGESERLPGVPYVMQAVSICSITVLPRLPPHNGGQNKHQGRRAGAQLHLNIAPRALFDHVLRGTIMV